ncbi:MAG: alpha/beta fold hydrolase [Bacteroidetes bacterium]|nr:alpha/beta fold hydrolase [Rhodothermia bacterium]MCX7906969.1 alpha/beta fold hydrolase [Bacteroidota bacterium]MDW8285379.1 alpha/beta fold hydrolase [Bacteroidota bacterium]
MRTQFTLWALLLFVSSGAAAQSRLTIERIMDDPRWMGSFPSNPFWSEDGRWLYFYWNPDGAPDDSLYKVPRTGGKPLKVSPEERRRLPPPGGVYNRARTRKLFVRDGDVFLYDIRAERLVRLTQTVERESDPRFLLDEERITFVRENNLFELDLRTGALRQRTDFRTGQPPSSPRLDEQQRWLQDQQLQLFEVLRQRRDRRQAAERWQEREQRAQRPPKTVYLGRRSVQNLQSSPDGRYITFQYVTQPEDNRPTQVPNYVTETGYTDQLRARPKVGSPQPRYEFAIYDTERDTILLLRRELIPGIYDLPDYERERRLARGDTSSRYREPRPIVVHGPFWSPDGQRAVVVAASQDNKDRWILRLFPETATVRLLDRQRDEAWIGGPGIGGAFSAGVIGWLPDSRRIFFQSEESGYSHLYVLDVESGQKRALTSGRFEVFSPFLSRDGRFFYFTSSEVHPGERHFYRIPVEGGTRLQLTSMAGNNEVVLSPDEGMLAIRHSYSNRPWELFLQENRPGAQPQQITDSRSEAFKAYPWRDPEIVTFRARDGALVYARLYKPERPNGAAVLFVHGAGYLQNVHRWWSSYFREYMFHNFLADHGYTVLDVDYRASAGYGRDWRTAVYRHMGGRDLDDYVDAAQYLVREHGIDPKRIGIYGGSYGGFLTLMALFTRPDVFAAGAALRPVTDWAHYNHPYTANILNLPYADSLAYVRSSPIYHAEGLRGGLLICHGMVDVNVHFQDVVRLVQRLIELRKENWELAVYPVEDHGFVEPTSWMDQYKRIFKLFERHLRGAGAP